MINRSVRRMPGSGSPCRNSNPGDSSGNALRAFFFRKHLVHFIPRLFLCLSVLLLNFALELIPVAGDLVELVIGQFTPALFHAANGLLPIAFDLVPVHGFVVRLFRALPALAAELASGILVFAVECRVYTIRVAAKRPASWKPELVFPCDANWPKRIGRLMCGRRFKSTLWPDEKPGNQADDGQKQYE